MMLLVGYGLTGLRRGKAYIPEEALFERLVGKLVAKS